jgi:HlyD family secretion protein
MSEQTGRNSGRIVRNVVIAAVVLAVVVAAVRYFSHSEVEIRTAKVSYGDLISNLSTSGKVEPVQMFQAHAAEPGTVEAVYVKAGQQVAAGTLLVKLNSESADSRVETARAAVAQATAAEHDINQGGSSDERIGLTGDLDRAKLQVQQSQKDLAALQVLQAKGAASAAEVAAAQSRLASAESSLQSIQLRTTQRYAPTDKQRVQAQLSDSRAALSAAQQTLSQAIVRAPFAGTVYSLPVRAYDFVGAGEELVQLADLTRVQVRAYFDEPEIGKLVNGAPVLIKWDAKPSKTWHGHIVRTPTTVITYGTRYVGECLIAVDDAAGDLLPNTNVNVSVTTQSVYHVLSLPREALRTQGDSNFVYVVDHGVLVKKPVQIGALNLMSVQITGGLNNNDVVALSPVSSTVDLTEGMAVKVETQ